MIHFIQVDLTYFVLTSYTDFDTCPDKKLSHSEHADDIPLSIEDPRKFQTPPDRPKDGLGVFRLHFSALRCRRNELARSRTLLLLVKNFITLVFAPLDGYTSYDVSSHIKKTLCGIHYSAHLFHKVIQMDRARALTLSTSSLLNGS